MSFYVHIGPAAVRFGQYWIGYASRNRDFGKRRRTAEKAIQDAIEIVRDRRARR